MLQRVDWQKHLGVVNVSALLFIGGGFFRPQSKCQCSLVHKYSMCTAGSRSSSVRSPRMSVFSPGGQSGLGSPMRPSVPMPPPPQQKIRNFGEPAFPLPPPYGANMTSCPPSPAVNPQLPECRALLFNLLMGDTMMNFFADKNFSGCTVCVCNMSVRSNECVGSNGGQNGLAVDEHPYKCSCGFSQVVNRR